MDMKYLCNGPRYDLSEPDFFDILGEFADRIAPADLRALDGSAYERPLTVGPITKGNRSLLFIRWDSGVAVRQYCGADLAEMIAAVPEDGEVHSVGCPECGTQTTVRKAGMPDMSKTDKILGAATA